MSCDRWEVDGAGICDLGSGHTGPCGERISPQGARRYFASGDAPRRITRRCGYCHGLYSGSGDHRCVPPALDHPRCTPWQAPDGTWHHDPGCIVSEYARAEAETKMWADRCVAAIRAIREPCDNCHQGAARCLCGHQARAALAILTGGSDGR
jgi:hypothetical protein